MRSVERRNTLYAFAIFIFFCFVFGKFADELIKEELYKFDSSIINWMQSFISSKLTTFMKAFTFFGSYIGVILISLITIILMIFFHKYWEALFLAIAVLGSSLFNLLLKWIFQRERPSSNQLIDVTGLSFPSGHAMVSIVLFGMLTYFLLLFYKSNWAKIITALFFTVVILCIGVSRIYLGVHYPSDVIAGFSAGGAWLIICLFVLQIIVAKRNTSHNKRHRNH